MKSQSPELFDRLIRPPCWQFGKQCPNHCAAALHDRVVRNHTALYGPWTGWRMAGQRLVGPDREWVSAPYLDRMLFREDRFR